MSNWIYLAVAIVSEVIATSALKASVNFSRFWPSLVVVLGYGVAFYFLSLALRTIPVGVAYAIWAGLGMVLIGLVGWLVFREHLDGPGIFGIALILAGVLVLKLFSKATAE